MKSFMQTKMFGRAVLLALVAVTALAQVPSEPVSPQTTEAIIPRRHGPRIVLPGTRPPQVVDGVTVSYNLIWAGYAVTGTEFTQVQGSWIVNPADFTTTPPRDSSEGGG